ncbi:MAG TPA: glycosyltransferase family 39 protein [Terriglobales bacterium]
MDPQHGNPSLIPFWRLVRESALFFLLVTLAAVLLRLLFFFKFPLIAGDSLIYGDIAKNWLNQGIFGLTHQHGIVRPTWIRLPGYPAFLATCFVLFGREHYNAVLLVQIVVDVVSCFFVADLARRAVSEQAARWAFLLAALCPFTANYTVAPLAETLSIFFTAVALDAAVAGFAAQYEGRQYWAAWAWCGVAIACGILLRPDGGILLIALGVYLLWRMWRTPGERLRLFWAGALVLGISIAPLAPWTIRNWVDFHQFMPLVPKSASDPNEFVPDGLDKWVRTWALDYVSTEEVYWQIPGGKVDVNDIPSRAFDTPGERRQTQAILDDYHKVLVINPALNARLMELANQRIRTNPIRYYVWLPAFRSLDMWVRPRTEMLPLDTRWWEYSDDVQDCLLATLWGVLNLLFLAAAVMGLLRGLRPRYLGMMLLFVVLRSAFLGTLANPEPRYTLECYPVVFLLGGAWISGWKKNQLRQQ